MQFILRFGLLAICLWAVACSENSSSASDFDAASICPENLRGTFIDDRDGQVYKYTTIGNQIWMAENLNYDSPHSYCADNVENYCEIFGRLYALIENEEDFGNLDSNLVATVCPAGWRVPSEEDWLTLMNTIGGEMEKDEMKIETEEGLKLNSPYYWGKASKNGTNECGFSALPAGYTHRHEINVKQFGRVASFWTTSIDPDPNGTLTSIKVFFLESSRMVLYFHSDNKMSIRCIKE